MSNLELLIFADNIFSHYVDHDGEITNTSFRETLDSFGLTRPFMFWLEEVRKNLIAVAVESEDES